MSDEHHHPDVDFAVDDAQGNEQIFKCFDEAAGFAVSIATATGEPVALDVLIFSESGAMFYGGDDAAAAYEEDPEMSVFERYEIRVDAIGPIP